jgi:hypothetical protein
MAITTQTGKVVVDTNLVPYIRGREVEFVAHNLKPYKIARIFFDDVAVNGFCQAGSRVLLDSKKVVEVDRNNAATVYQSDIVYQGTSATVNTFNGIVESFDTTNKKVTIRRLEGDFDDNAQLYFQNVRTTLTYSNANVVSVADSNTADLFFPGEGVIAPQRGNGFATVISTSGSNIIYLKQNYMNINVDPVGISLSVAASQCKPGDMVYQTEDGAQRYDKATFRGIVRYFHGLGQGMMAIEPIQGTFVANATNSTANAKTYIWNATTPSAAAIAANNYNSATFASNSLIASIQNSSVSINVSSFVHRSGVVANVNSGSASLLILNSNSGNAPALGNLIYFCSGTGVGEIKKITAINGANATLNSALTFVPDCTTRYSVGNHEVDEYGSLSGLFHIPSFPSFKFKTGNRIFTITDTARYNDPDYGMRAAASYAASGILQTTQRIQTTPVLSPLPETDGNSLVVPSSPADRPAVGTPVKSPVTGSTASTIPRIPLGDGMAQTFFVPKPNSNKQDYGIYCTSVDLFFKSKPSVATYFKNSKLISRGSLQLPVTVKIAEVQNGYPTKNYLASKTVNAKDVNVSDIPNVNDPTTSTKFTFDDPVFLEPNREYAIIVGSDSPDYELFIAELGADVLGSGTTTTVRISEQPYAGSFFRSQNSSTWTPYQNQDLMFVLNKAVFDTSGTVTFNLDMPPVANIDIDRVMLTSTDLKFPVGIVDYKLKGVYSSTLAQETSGVDLEPNKPVEFGTLLDKSAKTSINRRKLLQGNANSMILTVDMSSTDADVSPIVNIERLAITAATFSINNAGLSNTKIAITNYGAKYISSNTTSANPNTSISVYGSTSDTVNTAAIAFRNTYFPYPTYNVGLYAISIAGGNGSSAAGFALANTDSMNTVNAIVLTNMGSGYTTTPTVTIQDPTFLGTTGGTTATTVVSGEDGKSGGNILAKYLTREIILEDGFESGDLRVFMDAIRSTGTDILVYYKVRSGDDPESIGDKSWRLMSKVKDVFSRNPNTFVGLEFRPSLDENRINYTENGVSYPIGGSFKHFQIKVCMITSDQSLIPRVKNLRITAVPEG